MLVGGALRFGRRVQVKRAVSRRRAAAPI